MSVPKKAIGNDSGDFYLSDCECHVKQGGLNVLGYVVMGSASASKCPCGATGWGLTGSASRPVFLAASLQCPGWTPSGGVGVARPDTAIVRYGA